MNVDEEESDDQWEEEEQLVVVHLSGIIDMDYLKKCDATNCKVLGIDTEHPAMQIDRMIFNGNYSESMGTNIIFEEQTNETKDGEVSKDMKYKCHTTKNLDMIRVFLRSSKDSKKAEAGMKLDIDELRIQIFEMLCLTDSYDTGETSGETSTMSNTK